MTHLERSQDAPRERDRDLSQAFVIGASDSVGYHAGVWTLISDLLSSMQTQNQIVYFIRQAPVPITPENFEATVQFGTVRGSYIPALLRLLSGVFAPQIFANATWPESIRNHFASHLHRFLACLTGERKTSRAWFLSGAPPTGGASEAGGRFIPSTCAARHGVGACVRLLNAWVRVQNLPPSTGTVFCRRRLTRSAQT